MGNADVEYFSRRAREEEDAAAHSAPRVSAVHKELAEKYAGMVAAYEKDSK